MELGQKRSRMKLSQKQIKVILLLDQNDRKRVEGK